MKFYLNKKSAIKFLPQFNDKMLYKTPQKIWKNKKLKHNLF